MIDVEATKKLIEAALPEAQIELNDLTGTGDHFQAIVISDTFKGKSRVQRHQMIMTPLSELLKGPLHALSIVAKTKEEMK